VSGPFSNNDSGDLFIANRCSRCAHRDVFDEPCDAFLPAYLDEWPEILAKVPISDANPVGVECTPFEVAR
jgi:hypothetical protein